MSRLRTSQSSSSPPSQPTCHWDVLFFKEQTYAGNGDDGYFLSKPRVSTEVITAGDTRMCWSHEAISMMAVQTNDDDQQSIACGKLRYWYYISLYMYLYIYIWLWRTDASRSSGQATLNSCVSIVYIYIYQLFIYLFIYLCIYRVSSLLACNLPWRYELQYASRNPTDLPTNMWSLNKRNPISYLPANLPIDLKWVVASGWVFMISFFPTAQAWGLQPQYRFRSRSEQLKSAFPPGTGSQARVPRTGCQTRFPGTGARFPRTGSHETDQLALGTRWPRCLHIGLSVFLQFSHLFETSATKAEVPGLRGDQQGHDVHLAVSWG